MSRFVSILVLRPGVVEMRDCEKFCYVVLYSVITRPRLPRRKLTN